MGIVLTSCLLSATLNSSPIFSISPTALDACEDTKTKLAIFSIVYIVQIQTYYIDTQDIVMSNVNDNIGKIFVQSTNHTFYQEWAQNEVGLPSLQLICNSFTIDTLSMNNLNCEIRAISLIVIMSY